MIATNRRSRYYAIPLIFAALSGFTFETAALVVLSPNGGETVYIGDTLWVQWEVDPCPGVVISLSVDSGYSFARMVATTISPTDLSWTNYPIVIPDSIAGVSTRSPACLIKIYVYANPSEYDESDGYFTISSAKPALPGDDGCGCGSGTGMALLPAFLFRITGLCRKKRKIAA